MERKIVFTNNINEEEILTVTDGMTVRTYVEKALENRTEEDLKEGYVNIGEVIFMAMLNDKGEIEITQLSVL